MTNPSPPTPEAVKEALGRFESGVPGNGPRVLLSVFDVQVLTQALRASEAKAERLKAEVAAQRLELQDLDAAELLAAERLEGLKKIERWEMPETGKFWPDDLGNPNPTRPMSYASCYGSNGERDYIRSIARALTQPKTEDAE